MQHCNKIPLSANNIIRNFLAGFLLVVFAFGITPKRTLHNLLANHKDGKAGAFNSNLKGEVLSRASFNCQCDNLISESPFVDAPGGEIVEIAKPFQVFIAGQISQPVSSSPSSSALRGPPSC